MVFLWLRLIGIRLRELCDRALLTVTGYLRRQPDRQDPGADLERVPDGRPPPERFHGRVLEPGQADHLPQPEPVRRVAQLEERPPPPLEAAAYYVVAEGLANAEVAKQLWISEPTVKSHLSRTYEKLGVSNRTGAARWAERHGLLDRVAS